MGTITKRVSIVVAAVAMVAGMAACTPSPSPGGSPPSCLAGPYGIGVYYEGPIDTADNATSNSEPDCTGDSTGLQTVVYGPDEATADAACDTAKGDTKGAFATLEAPNEAFWVCVV